MSFIPPPGVPTEDRKFFYIAHQLISTCTTAVGRAHISCYASAQQLLCD